MFTFTCLQCCAQTWVFTSLGSLYLMFVVFVFWMSFAWADCCDLKDFRHIGVSPAVIQGWGGLLYFSFCSTLEKYSSLKTNIHSSNPIDIVVPLVNSLNAIIFMGGGHPIGVGGGGGRRPYWIIVQKTQAPFPFCVLIISRMRCCWNKILIFITTFTQKIILHLCYFLVFNLYSSTGIISMFLSPCCPSFMIRIWSDMFKEVFPHLVH